MAGVGAVADSVTVDVEIGDIFACVGVDRQNGRWCRVRRGMASSIHILPLACGFSAQSERC